MTRRYKILALVLAVLSLYPTGFHIINVHVGGYPLLAIAVIVLIADLL